MKYIMITLSLLLWSKAAFSQSDFGKIWIQGGGVSFKTSFNGASPVNAFFDTSYSPQYVGGHSNICNATGNLIFTCTGYQLFDKTSNPLLNGDYLVPPLIYDAYSGASLCSQSSIILPAGGSKYYVITPTASDSMFSLWNTPNVGAKFDQVFYHVVDATQNNLLGSVIEKQKLVLNGVNLSITQMMACRHGDGKSWWLLKAGKFENTFYKFLFTMNTVHGPWVQQFQSPPPVELNDTRGQSVFSKDGTKFASTFCGSGRVFLADFDRCTGELSNSQTIDVPVLWSNNPNDSTLMDPYTNGVAFSPNGRFLYVVKHANILQLDLDDNNMSTAWSHIAGLDTTWDAFMLYNDAYLGPDDKLYIGNWNGLSSEMSVINSPNSKGAAAGFCPRCLRFPKYQFPAVLGGGVGSPPCMPNYKLGATNPSCTVSVPDIDKTSVFSISADMARQELVVKYAEPGDLMIVDASGVLITRAALKGVGPNAETLKANFSPGILAYSFLSESGKASGKILVK